eukprot:TRINITY_DN6115_c0_g1_i10.p2 TRINITY_DN6115_c0_g1~~TRINITY_DN6115_c0_g1_i10.p2  ORF type:complete len:233 (-),score=53.42 TRINITY_DN6115_c0_g1_i10:1604-2302(-)
MCIRDRFSLIESMSKESAGIILLFFLFAAAAEDCTVTLSTHNFSELVDHSPHTWLVMFIDEKCGYCRDIRPLWSETVEKLCGDSNLRFGVVELKANSDLRYRFEVDSTLAFKLIKNGRVYTLDSSYSVQNLTDFTQRGSAVLTGELLPSYKSSLKKLWLVFTGTFTGLLTVFDSSGFSYLTKVVLLTLLLVSPLVLAALLLWCVVPKASAEEEQVNSEALKAMKMRAMTQRK